MNLETCCNMLADNARRIRLLVENTSELQARWKPSAESWSVLEVVNHLLDEENLDFKIRLEITLFHPEQPWPGIDPQGWVTERRYNQRDLETSLANFLAAREHSLAWLYSLSSPDWDAHYDATWGTMRAGDLMAAWAAHDLLHMRQLVALHWSYAEYEFKPYSAAYAGDW